MSEREPRRSRPDQQRTEPAHPAWDLAAIAQALNAPPDPERVEDIAFGEGQRFQWGDGQRRHLELYPRASVLRLTLADAQLSLFRQGPPTIGEREVVFERPGLFLAITKDGAVTLLTAPQTPATTPPQSPAEAVSGPAGRGIPEEV